MQRIFEGLTVLDCASFIAAPAAATILADFGADVTKIEPPTGDTAVPDVEGVGLGAVMGDDEEPQAALAPSTASARNNRKRMATSCGSGHAFQSQMPCPRGFARVRPVSRRIPRSSMAGAGTRVTDVCDRFAQRNQLRSRHYVLLRTSLWFTRRSPRGPIAFNVRGHDRPIIDDARRAHRA